MNDKASITALMSSFGRAFHAENEEAPVFADGLARELMTAEEYDAVQGYIRSGAQFFEPEMDTVKVDSKELVRKLVNTHIAPSPLCRAAYTENALKTAVQTGTKQYVILGAGMDTFAFRESEFLSNYKVFEVDHPETQKDKLVRIHRADWKVPRNLTFVPVDFSKDCLTEQLIRSGFDPSVKTFFSWLGVTYYLSTEAIDTTLSALSELCEEGSTLVFDYPDESFLDANEKRVQNTIMMAKAGGEPMQSTFSYVELETMLEKHDFLIYELMTPADIQKNIIDKAGADMKAFEHVNYCLAVRKSKNRGHN
ncbi:MAG: class I SAM-dependent methyltransferase [bacterium]|nr:class I SAM-dependent methyltransferase [bacterium]